MRLREIARDREGGGRGRREGEIAREREGGRGRRGEGEKRGRRGREGDCGPN